jgi:hypothetical protein
MSESGTASQISAEPSCFHRSSLRFHESAFAQYRVVLLSHKRPFLKEATVPEVLNNWLFIGANAYVEYTFVPWLGRSVYRRTVDYSDICLQ